MSISWVTSGHGPWTRTTSARWLTWQAEAARRARRAGFDIVYVYAGMDICLTNSLLSDWNQRTDAYGGSVRNRVRIVRELLEVNARGGR